MLSARARPPRSLVALIAAITVLPLLTLLWLGWRLLEQDRLLEGQQVQQRVERAADLVVSALQRQLSNDEQRLASSADHREDAAADGALVVVFRNGLVDVPPGHVAYLPVVAPQREPPDAIFAEGEDLELRQRTLPAAVDVYARLAKSSDAAIVAGALLRLGRSLQKTGRTEEALDTYARLSNMDTVAVGGVPAGLVGTYARGRLLEARQRSAELKALGADLRRWLHSGRWALTAPVYHLYKQDADRWSGTSSDPPPAEAFADAIGLLWERWTSTPAPLRTSGERETVAVGGSTLTVVSKTTDESFRALLATPAFIKARWLGAIEPIAREQHVRVEVEDLVRIDLPADAPARDLYHARRNARDSTLPWALAIFSADPPPERAAFVVRRYSLIAGLLLLLSMALLASYLIVRAVGRELSVARLQSDFVAAVSHEFRTPLTTLRQFTDMLREQPSLSAERRSIAYEAQSRATERLTRLVESILDFGRMEAGAHRYRFQPHDCTRLVRRILEDYAPEARTAGYDIAFRGDAEVPVEGDGEALSTAIRNLLDNAVKYSPAPNSIQVALRRRNGHVHISVQDHGIGIPAHEQADVFTRFHRGEQARIRGIKGTGIGLAMVQEVVKAHRGHVELESVPGAGSTFTIVLPVKE